MARTQRIHNWINSIIASLECYEGTQLLKLRNWGNLRNIVVFSFIVILHTLDYDDSMFYLHGTMMADSAHLVN